VTCVFQVCLPHPFFSDCSFSFFSRQGFQTLYLHDISLIFSFTCAIKFLVHQLVSCFFCWVLFLVFSFLPQITVTDPTLSLFPLVSPFSFWFFHESFFPFFFNQALRRSSFPPLAHHATVPVWPIRIVFCYDTLTQSVDRLHVSALGPSLLLLFFFFSALCTPPPNLVETH